MTAAGAGAPVPECRYLALVRELAAATRATCHPDCGCHVQDAAWHINAFIQNPRMIHDLFVIAERLGK